MTNEDIAKIYNLTFGGLTLFYRDANLPEDLISKYEVGQILMERGFTDMSYKGGGITTNCRYLIASAFAKDVSSIMPDAKEFGLTMLPSGAFFKVLDIYKIGEVTQIFLLNIPEDTVSFFSKATSNIEQDIVQKARESLDSKVNTDPVPELEKKEWKERTKFPIGISDTGESFYQMQKQTHSNHNKPKSNTPWWKFW